MFGEHAEVFLEKSPVYSIHTPLNNVKRNLRSLGFAGSLRVSDKTFEEFPKPFEKKYVPERNYSYRRIRE